MVAISSTPMPPIVVGVNSSGICPSSEPARSGRNDGSSPKSSRMVLHFVDIAGSQMAAGQHIDPPGIRRVFAFGVSTSTSTMRATVFSQPSWNASLKSGVET